MVDWSAIGSGTLLVLGLFVLLLVNAAGVLMVAFQLPGTWLILLATTLAAAVSPRFGWPTLLILLPLALLGELIEFAGSAAGARVAGAGRRAAWLALAGSIAGAVVGTFTIALPILGTLAGAAIGAAAGSIVGDRWAGRQWGGSIKGGGGAAIGRLSGAVGKLIVATIMWLVVAVAIFV